MLDLILNMPLIRKKNIVAVNLHNDSNINQQNDESHVANDAPEEEEKNKDIEESNETVLTNHPSNDDDVMPSRERHQNSNVNDKNQSCLLDNRAECITNKTCMQNMQQNKVVYCINRDIFSTKKPTKNDDKFVEQLKFFFLTTHLSHALSTSPKNKKVTSF